MKLTEDVVKAFFSDRMFEFYVYNSSYANYVKYYLIDKLKQFKVV